MADPIGYVRWQKFAGRPGRLVARNDAGTTPDADLIRSFRRYLGVVAETIDAADGVIRLRDRWSDPDKTSFRAPRTAVDKAKPPVNDLVWIEGHLRVLGDMRMAGGRLDFRDETGGDGKGPLALRRIEPNKQGGADLQAVIGGDGTPTGKHAFAVGPVKLDTTTGALGDMDKKLLVRDSGNVGIGTEAPTQLLTLAGDKKTRLEIGKVSDAFPLGSAGGATEGAFAINQQSKGSDSEGADFALMRDLKLRVVLGDVNTFVSSQGDGSVCILSKEGEPGQKEVMRATSAGFWASGLPRRRHRSMLPDASCDRGRNSHRPILDSTRRSSQRRGATPTTGTFSYHRTRWGSKSWDPSSTTPCSCSSALRPSRPQIHGRSRPNSNSNSRMTLRRR